MASSSVSITQSVIVTFRLSISLGDAGKDLFRLFIGGSGAAGDKLKISRKIHLLPLYRLAVDHQLDHRMRGNGGVLAVSAIYRKLKIPAQRHSGGTVRPAPGVLCFKVCGLGVFLNYLFQKTFAVAKEVRSKTEIGAHSVSLAAAGVRVASSIFGSLENSNILFVGAGEMIELCAAHFCAQKPKNIAVANRTVARAAALAETIGAKAVGLVDLPEILPEYDILITCTASTLPIIGLGMVQSALKRRKHRPIFMIDLAVPRDIEREVDDLDEVYVYTVDDLGKVVQSGIQGRKAAVEQADRLIETKVDEFKCWMTTRSSIPQILSLQERADALRMMELEKAKKAIQKGGDANEILEAMSHGLMKKFIHDPLTVLRNDPNLSQEDYEKVLHLLDRFYHYHIHHR